MTNETENLCLYRTWTEKVNDKSQKIQACYPHNGGGCGISAKLDGKELKKGEVIKGFLDDKNHQVIECKFPECL